MPFLFCGGGGMVDAYVWGAYGFNGREGSSPFLRTKLEICLIQFVSNFFYFEDREYNPLFHFHL